MWHRNQVGLHVLLHSCLSNGIFLPDNLRSIIKHLHKTAILTAALNMNLKTVQMKSVRVFGKGVAVQ
jgi:uncharacterized membrane protein (DUF2068 family)